METSDKNKVGVTWLLSRGGEFPGVSDHASTTEHPLPGRGMGWCRETLVRHGIPFDSTKPSCQVKKGLWPHHSVGTSPLSPLPDSRGGGPQSCTTGGWRNGLAVHLYKAKWCHIPCAPIKWRAHLHHDGWCPQHGCQWLASPAADKQTVAAQGQGSVPRGFKQGTRGPTVHFPRAALLGHCHSQWALLRTTTSRSGSQQCAAWEHGNCHSGSHYYTGANPLSGQYHWASLQHHHGCQLTSPGGLGMAAVDFPHSLSPYLWM